VAEVALGVVIVTLTVPAVLAGLVAVIEVLDPRVNVVADVVPK
jgi:hypothetical protein